jgi:hypothetical protein
VGSGEGAALRSGSRGAGRPDALRGGGTMGAGAEERAALGLWDAVRCGAVRRLGEARRGLLAIVGTE